MLHSSPSAIVRFGQAFLSRTVLNRLRHRPLSLPAPTPVAAPLNPEECLDIQICTATDDQKMRDAAWQQGRFLARQDQWDLFADLLVQNEANRETTICGMPLADLLALGARSDVVLGAEHALLDGTLPSDARLPDGIAALEEVLDEFPNSYAIAVTVALAHIDIGWAWRGTGWDATVPRPNRAAFQSHFDRARTILEPYCALELNSPILAAARCALLPSDPDPHARLADDYEDLIDLDPANHRHMRALGTQLLPRWAGNYDQLDLQARRTTQRTKDIWGPNGGYTWVYLDAIASDEQACAHVDPYIFICGLRDIVSRRPDQRMINLLTAYCAITLQQRLGYDPIADYARTQIAECTRWLIRDHLTEVHPVIWAHAGEGADTTTRTTSRNRIIARGRADALQAICDNFSEDILRGHIIRFTSEGPKLVPV